MILTGENRSTPGKTCPSATLSTTNPTWTDQGSNPGLRDGRPATNRLSHGTACIVALVIEHANRILFPPHFIVIWGLSGCIIFFPHYLINSTIFGKKKVIELIICALILYTTFEKFLNLRRTSPVRLPC
jgi:hypothetical protein